jgi:hypothetical protein
MALPPPSYVPLALLEKMPVSHRWNDWDPYSLLGTQDPTTQMRLARVSDRAQIAYAIGCAEWVTYRFQHLFDDLRPYEFLEASWACEMSSDFATPPQLAEEEWQGPIRAPIDLSLVTILNTFYTTEDGSGEVDAAFAERIPLHVLTDHAPFLQWRDRVFDRFEKLFHRETNDLLGSPVPREAMDPDVPVSEEMLDKYVGQFFSQLGQTANPFLRKVKRS